MEELCVLVGAARCRRVRYEDLVTDTRATLAGLVHACAGDDRPDCPILADLAAKQGG